MKPIKLVAVVLTALLLAGCPSMTSMLWADNQPAVHYVDKKVGEDRIQAFGVVREANSQLPPNSIVMMGNRYWFVLEPKYTERISRVLNAKLDRPFEIMRTTASGERVAPVKVSLLGEGQSEFSSYICLRYVTAQAVDKEVLIQAGFENTAYTQQGAVYKFCQEVSGKIYTAPPSVQQDYRFEQSFPVEVWTSEAKTSSRVPAIAGRVLLTPFALAIDAITAVVRIPMNASFNRNTGNF